MTTNNFYYALSLLDLLYGITMQEDQFEEVGYIAWELIGNKRCKLYKHTYCLEPCLKSIELPCNCDLLEAVTTDFEDFLHVSNIHDTPLPGSFSTENYIESRKAFKDPLYLSGKYIQFERVGNTLYFNEPYSKINILYKGVQLDDNGLPEITDKEARAIAAYCAYVVKFKEGIRTNNTQAINMSTALKELWVRACDLARVPEEMTQNEWDEVLDTKNSWDRKIYSRSYKAIR